MILKASDRESSLTLSVAKSRRGGGWTLWLDEEVEVVYFVSS